MYWALRVGRARAGTIYWYCYFLKQRILYFRAIPCTRALRPPLVTRNLQLYLIRMRRTEAAFLRSIVSFQVKIFTFHFVEVPFRRNAFNFTKTTLLEYNKPFVGQVKLYWHEYVMRYLLKSFLAQTICCLANRLKNFCVEESAVLCNFTTYFTKGNGFIFLSCYTFKTFQWAKICIHTPCLNRLVPRYLHFIPIDRYQLKSLQHKIVRSYKEFGYKNLQQVK